VGKALGDVLGLAAGVAISPLPIVAIILILATPRGRLNGTLFLTGWVAGLSILGAAVLAIGGPAGTGTHHQPATWTGVLKIGLGVLLVLLGARQWHHRPADTSLAHLPRWMAAIDHLTPIKILGLGLVLSAANLKNAPLTIAAAASISSAGLPAGQQIASMAVFVTIGSLGLLTPLAIFLIKGEQARTLLGDWKNWAARHNAAVMAALFFVLGMKLLGDGIGILTA